MLTNSPAISPRVPTACASRPASCRATALLVVALAACGFPKPADVAECTHSTDCASATAPYCVDSTCAAACQHDDSCAGLAGTPFCQTASGKCVGCLDAIACTVDKPVCDVAGSCRACTRDDECAGGICVETTGTCAADSSVVFVAGFGPNSGACTRDAPCSLPYGVSHASAVRSHIKIVNGTLALTATLTLPASLYIEGSDTVVTGPDGMISLAQGANITLSHMKLQPASGLVVTVGAAQTLRLFDVQTSGGVSVNGGTLDVDLGTFTGGGGVACMNGTATVRRTLFDHSPMSGTTCQLVVRRSHIDFSGDAGFHAEGGTLTFENNLFTQSEGIADNMTLVNVSSLSTVRFNTFVNTTPSASDGDALSCTTPLEVTSNIFAYQSMHPLGCDTRYSLLDSVALPSFSMTVGSKAGDSATFFVDKAGKDYHLAAASPARGAAEAGLGVSDDFDGATRPSPAGAQPDIGAFETR